MDQLPGEVLSLILSSLSIDEAVRSFLACKRSEWTRIVYDSIRHLDISNGSLDLDRFQRSIDFFTKYGQHLSQLTTVRLGSEAPLPNMFSYFFMLPLHHLTYVQLAVHGAAVLNALAKNNSQVRQVALYSRNGCYHEIDTEALANLNKLNLLYFYAGSSTNATVGFLEQLARKLPQLEELLICTTDWRPLRAMENLKRLFVFGRDLNRFINAQTPETLRDAIALQREYNPPAVGLNLAVSTLVETNDIVFANLLTSAIRHSKSQPNNNDMIRMVVANGFDLKTQVLDNCHHPTKYSVLTYALTLAKNCIAAQALIELGADPMLAEKSLNRHEPINTSRRTAFAHSLVMWHRGCWDKPEWINYMDWLFKTHYKAAIASGANRSSALNINDTGDSLLCQLAETVTVEKIGLTCKWLRDNSSLLGVEVDPKTAQNHSGCNLAHLSTSGVDIACVNNLHIDWRHRDHRGFTAIQCLASRFKGSAVDELMLATSDEEFLGHCSPRVWGVIGGPYGPEYSSSLEPLLARFVRLVPEIHWAELITMAVNVHLRLSPSPSSLRIVQEYLGHSHPMIKKLAWRAFFEPFDISKLAELYQPVQNFARHFYTKPLPHVLCARGATALARSVLQYAKANVAKADLNGWLTLKDAQLGLSCVDFMTKVCTWCYSGDVDKMRELFKPVP